MDPLSIVGGVVGLAVVALQGCKKANDFISALVNVYEVLQPLKKDLDRLQTLLQSLQDALMGIDDDSLSESQKACFRDLGPTLVDCKTVCDKFAATLSHLTKHSKEGEVSKRDRIRVHFGEEDIKLHRSTLAMYISTLDIAIGLATFTTVLKNSDALKELETTITTSMSSFAGQISGLEAAIHALTRQNTNGSKQDLEAVKIILDQHRQMLGQCLMVSTKAFEVTTVETGTRVQYAKVWDEARQFIGNIGNVGPGGPATNVGKAEASGKAGQIVGNMPAESVMAFFGAPASQQPAVPSRM
ncbi:hypothetical protein QBC39DRAFT_105331 [Podospora conica]|nr:hypothetical protein QBC39DRAFT_105331 [Schizothecium conicum]